VLRPTLKDQREKLSEQTGRKSVVPLDDWLGVSRLPFRISVKAMLEIAFWAQNQCSYQRAEEILKRNGIPVNDTTIREVTNYIGSYVFKRDCRQAEEATMKYNKCEVPFTRERDGVLYIEVDGAALNTRQKDENGSTWRENKLGEVFSSDDIRWWTDKHGKPRHVLMRKEYTSYIGSAEEFKKHLLACAIRNGYGNYKETVLLSDGATWIRNMKEEFFPDAQQILDYYHLCENVNNYAKNIFNADRSHCRLWAEQTCAALKAGKYKEVLRELGKPNGKRHITSSINLYGYILL
jgi:hypothetical protein